MTRKLKITEIVNCARDEDEEDVTITFEEPTVVEVDDSPTFTYGNVIKVNPIHEEIKDAFGRKSWRYFCPICNVFGHKNELSRNVDDECLHCGININWFDVKP